MHAVVVNVSIEESQFDASRKVLHERVVPQVSKSPGFVKGYWTVAADHRKGTSIVVFQTQSDAENAAQAIRSQPSPAPGVTVANVEIREVVADA